MPLIFATQTAETTADLDIEGINSEEPSAPITSNNTVICGTAGLFMPSPGEVQTMIGASTTSQMSGVQMNHPMVTDRRVTVTTVPTAITRASSVTSMVPYDRSSINVPPYNSSAML